MIFLYQFLVAPLILWFILFLLARNHGSRQFSTLFYVCIGITLISLGATIYLPQFAIIVIPVACVLLIQKFCYIGWIRSIIATILYMAAMLFCSILFDKATH
jgi:uncharacterized membrane protein YczE